MAVMACVATLMMGLGQDNLMLPALTIVVAAGGLYVTDVKRWFVLNTAWANVAGLAALLLTLSNLASTGRDLMFLALANLLVYLKCVLFFREKVDRIYWMICLLSLLEVVVASVLNYSFWFGPLLVVFCVSGLHVMMLFLLRREQSRCLSGGAETSATHGAASDAPLSVGGVTWLPSPAPSVAPVSLRWPLAGQRPQTAPFGRGEDDDRATLGIRRQTLKMAAAAFLLLPVLFLLLPRPTAGRGGWNSGGAAGAVTGFSSSVSLNTSGPITQSDQEVMQVRFFTAAGTPYALQEEPLFRGTSMTNYMNGEWHEGNMGQRRRDMSFPPADARSIGDLVIQDITLPPMRSAHVFSVSPTYLAPRSHPRRLRVASSYGRIERYESERGLEVQLELATLGLRDGRNVPILPQPTFDTDDAPLIDNGFLAQLLHFSPQLHAGLAREAARIVGDLPQESRSDPVAQARALESYLRDSGRFRYTLDRSPGDRRIDPIEDFVVNSPEGSCFNFAAALTLMLRSQGIPARIVNGYKGGDWNELGEYYVVRQLHAHAWVEAWLRRRDLPPEYHNVNSYQSGGWLMLDPTPAADDRHYESAWPGLREFQDYLQHLWGHYVLGMNENRQSGAIYQSVASLFQAETYAAMLRDVRNLFSGEKRELESSGPALVIFLLGIVPLTCFALYRLGRWMWRHWRTARAPVNGRRTPTGPPVEFYLRLESLLAALGIRRAPNQTQREFALSAGGVLADRPGGQVAASAPRRVVSAFYQVRFGNQALTSDQIEEVRGALASLAAVVPKANGHISTEGIKNA